MQGAVCHPCNSGDARGLRTEPVSVIAPMTSPRKAVVMCTPSRSPCAPSAASMMLAIEVTQAARPTREW